MNTSHRGIGLRFSSCCWPTQPRWPSARSPTRSSPPPTWPASYTEIGAYVGRQTPLLVGLKLAGIDVVSCGHRVRRGAGYPPLYSTLLADRPAAGQRDTRLIVGLDLTDSVRGLSYRTSIGAAAAAATERIINALLQEGIRAAALNAAELDAALEELSAGLADAPEPPEEQVDADVDARVPVLAGAPSGVLPRRMTLAPTGQPLSSERGQLARLRQADWNPERMVVQ